MTSIGFGSYGDEAAEAKEAAKAASEVVSERSEAVDPDKVKGGGAGPAIFAAILGALALPLALIFIVGKMKSG